MVKAIARAFRWRDMLESGECATIREITNAEKIKESYEGRMLRLTLLAPDIVEAILNGRQPAGLQLAFDEAVSGGLAGAAGGYEAKLFATNASLGPQILKARIGR